MRHAVPNPRYAVTPTQMDHIPFPFLPNSGENADVDGTVVKRCRPLLTHACKAEDECNLGRKRKEMLSKILSSIRARKKKRLDVLNKEE